MNNKKSVAEQELQDAFRVAIDSIHDNRRKVLLPIAQGRNVENFGLPRTVADRELQELQVLDVITRSRPYRLTDKAAKLVEAADIVVDGVPLLKIMRPR